MQSSTLSVPLGRRATGQGCTDVQAFRSRCCHAGLDIPTLVLGFVDYLAVPMSVAAKRLATTHMALNLSAVVLYIVSLFLRMNNAAFQTSRWIGAMALQIVPW